MVAVALPLVPIGAGVALSAATFVLGSAAYIAQQVHGFRAPLPPLTGSRGKAGDKTLQELIADAIAGARIPIALPPNCHRTPSGLTVRGASSALWHWLA